MNFPFSMDSPTGYAVTYCCTYLFTQVLLMVSKLVARKEQLCSEHRCRTKCNPQTQS